jgi:hypothetical protein
MRVKLPKWLQSKSRTAEKKEYKFRLHEIVAAGGFYEYYIEAESRDEAFKTLVNWFYGDSTGDVKQKTGTVHMPQHDRFYWEGMPEWFARRISGQVATDKVDYEQKLLDYCNENNIVRKR